MDVDVWGFVFGLVGALTGLIGAVALIWPPTRRRLGAIAADVRKRWSGRRASRAAARQQREYAACLATATAGGHVVPVRHSGYRPTEVTFSNDDKRYFFAGDMAAYTSAMRSGRYPLAHTFHTAPPPCPCGQTPR